MEIKNKDDTRQGWIFCVDMALCVPAKKRMMIVTRMLRRVMYFDRRRFAKVELHNL